MLNYILILELVKCKYTSITMVSYLKLSHVNYGLKITQPLNRSKNELSNPFLFGANQGHKQ